MLQASGFLNERKDCHCSCSLRPGSIDIFTPTVTFATMKLFFRELGEGQPIVIMHGVFGSSDNWLTQARMLSSHYRVFTLDLRNHGQSPHSEEFDYKLMVSDLEEF